ncbi:MAG TPA: glycosyltransferase [Gaiellaceae bacterium]|nr:glycosyltransferase [Gaiellaceae bacterium]
MAETSVAVVMLIHNRLERTLDSLRELQALPERPPIVVVDNASRNGTPAAVRSNFPPVQVIELPENIGAAARNCGSGLSIRRTSPSRTTIRGGRLVHLAGRPTPFIVTRG